MMAIGQIAGLAQNLVPNGSFECGEDICDAYQSPQVADFSRYACGWSCPNQGTTDIFTTKIPITECYTHMPYSGPNYHQGNQLPRTGSRFAGIYTYGTGGDTVSYREYLQVPLEQPMIPGEKYCAEMYVSKAETNYYSSNNLGMSFQTQGSYTFDYAPLNLDPQVLETEVITDTSDWVKIGAILEADSAWQYLIVGNFFGDGSTQAVASSPYYYYPYGYYFIDDVSVEKLPYDEFTLSGTDPICRGDSSIVTASVGVDRVFWTPLEDTTRIVHVGPELRFLPGSDTVFRVKVTGCRKTVIDTVRITVKVTPEVDLGSDTTLCEGETLLLSAGEGHLSYRWQDGSGLPTFEVSEAGMYWAEASNGLDCTASDEIEIRYEKVPEISLGEDVLACPDFPELNPGGNGYEYLWSTGATDTTYIPTASGWYWVEASNQCGVQRDSIRIYAAGDVYIPNVVTLNGDQLNERLILGVLSEDGSVDTGIDFPASVKITNRHGKPLFESYPYQGDWPAPDSDIPAGIYYYYVVIPGCRDFRGWLQLIR
jgi:hypothetical protein